LPTLGHISAALTFQDLAIVTKKLSLKSLVTLPLKPKGGLNHEKRGWKSRVRVPLQCKNWLL